MRRRAVFAGFAALALVGLVLFVAFVSTASAVTPAYSTIGSHKTGVWLIAKNREGAFVNYQHLPAEGQGYRYYWLGDKKDSSTYDRVDSALKKLGVEGFGWSADDVNKALDGKVVATANWDPLVGIALASAGVGAVLGAGAAATVGAGDAVAGGGAAGAAKSALGDATAAEPKGSAAQALSTPAMAALAVAALKYDKAAIGGDPTRANVGAGWFQDFVKSEQQYGWLIAIPIFIIAAMYTIVVSDGALLLQVLKKLLIAAFMMGTVLAILPQIIAIVDALSGSALGPLANQTRDALDAMQTGLAALVATSTLTSVVSHIPLVGVISKMTGTAAWLLAAGTLLTAGTIALEFLARDMFIYLLVAMLPLIAIFEIAPFFFGWAEKLLKALFADVTSKLFLIIALGVFGGILLNAGAVGALLGVIGLAAVAVSPFIVYRAVGLAVQHSHIARQVQAAGAVVGYSSRDAILDHIHSRTRVAHEQQEVIDSTARPSPVLIQPPPRELEVQDFQTDLEAERARRALDPPTLLPHGQSFGEDLEVQRNAYAPAGTGAPPPKFSGRTIDPWGEAA